MIPTLKCEKQKQTHSTQKKILIRKKKPRKDTKHIHFQITFSTKILLCTHSQGELQINIDKISQKNPYMIYPTFPFFLVPTNN